LTASGGKEDVGGLLGRPMPLDPRADEISAIQFISQRPVAIACRSALVVVGGLYQWLRLSCP
jgi:hypothetical protein